MTCPHCQTWILDDDHRCRRCGRRLRSAPQPSSSERFPISTDATAREYQFDSAAYAQPVEREIPVADAEEQRALFSNPNPSRVLSFEAFASPAERESIRARAAAAARP